MRMLKIPLTTFTWRNGKSLVIEPQAQQDVTLSTAIRYQDDRQTDRRVDRQKERQADLSKI